MYVFVFGSNLAGRHGKGAALEAVRNWGAIRGQGSGAQGRAWAIPTKGQSLNTLSLAIIENWIHTFRCFARSAQNSPDMTFLVTRIGCGLAGYRNDQVAPMFIGASPNCQFDPEWTPWGLKPWDISPDELVRQRKHINGNV